MEEVKSFVPVTMIDLGLMGHALAKEFLEGGYPTTVWNRSADKTDDLVVKRAIRAVTVIDAISENQVIVVCLSTYEVMHKLFRPLEEDLSGPVIINLTSGTSEEARQTAQWSIVKGYQIS